MIIKIITNIFLIICLGTVQIAFISGLPGWFNNLNLVLVILVFILGFVDFNFAVWWSAGVGLLLEIFSFSPFGTYLIGLCLTLIIISFLLNHFFTNRSLYSFLALNVLATMIYELIINFIFLFFSQIKKTFFITSLDFWTFISEQIVLNLLFTTLIYYLFFFLGRNLRPVFLIKNKKY